MSTCRQETPLDSAPGHNRQPRCPFRRPIVARLAHLAVRGWILAALVAVFLPGCSSFMKHKTTTATSYSHSSQKSSKSKESQPSGLSALFQKEPPPPKSVEDWMSLKRLDP